MLCSRQSELPSQLGREKGVHVEDTHEVAASLDAGRTLVAAGIVAAVVRTPVGRREGAQDHLARLASLRRE